MRLLSLLAILVGSLAASAAGPVYNVTTTSDAPDFTIDGVCETAPGNGICTMRAAFMEAASGPNPTAEQVTINIPAGTYKLTIPIGAPDDGRNGDLYLAGPVKVQGAGRGKTTLDANHVDRLMSIGAGADVKLYDLTISGGRPNALNTHTAPGGGKGGAIYSLGTLTIVRCSLSDNVTGLDPGGALYIDASSGSLTIFESELGGNVAGNGQGGGAVWANTTTLIVGSTLDGNAAGSGGAIYDQQGVLSVVNSTIVNNLGTLDGGGIHAQGGSVSLYNATLENNGTNQATTSSGSGGGVYVYFATLAMYNSILANHDLNAAPDDLYCTAFTNIYTNGYGIIRGAKGCVDSGAYSTSDPMLASLSSLAGGTTSTKVPQPGSPAVEAGAPTGCIDQNLSPLTTDQRGVKRPISANCDLGAVEVEPKGDANGDGSVTVADVFYLINFLFANGSVPKGRANVNGDGSINVNDVFYLINYLFAGGSPPV